MKIKGFAAGLLLATATVFAQESPTPQPEAPSPDAPPPATPTVPSESDPAAEVKKVVDALKKLKISGYIQAQYVNDERSQDVLNTPSSTRNLDQFSIRRARVKFVYKAAPFARFTFQPEVTSSGTSLKDAFVELTEQRTPWKNTLTAGQFNWPFGFEIAYSSSDRELPERTRVVRALFPGERDRGVMVSGAAPSGLFNYRVAIVNGSGTTQSFDFNSDKDLVARLGTSIGPLALGVSGYEGTDLASVTGTPTGVEFDKTRQGFDFQLDVPFVQGLGLRGEYIQGEERGADVAGWYAYVIQNFGARNQVAIRADSYDPNRDRGDNATFTLGGAYIFHFDKHAKLMLAYERPELEENDIDDNVATARLQYKF